MLPLYVTFTYFLKSLEKGKLIMQKKEGMNNLKALKTTNSTLDTN